MDTYVINLAHDRARMVRIDAALRQLGILYTRVEATLGSELEGPDRRAWQHLFDAGMSNSEVGCCVSHISVWKRFLDSGSPHCLILEDDIHFGRGAREFIDWLTLNWRQPGILRLETFSARVTLELPACESTDGRDICRMLSPHGGAGAYVMSRDAALDLVEAAPRFRHMIDTEMFNPEIRILPQLEIFQCNPALCIQDFLLPESKRIGFDSNIGMIRQESVERNLMFWTKRALKHAFRPLYLAAKNTRLRRQGLVHRDIKFE